MDMDKKPCLYFRDIDGHAVGFFDNEPETWEAMNGLYDKGHRFELHAVGDVLILNAGFYDTSRIKLSDATKLFVGHGPAFTPESEPTIKNTCDGCERKIVCDEKYEGPKHTAPYPLKVHPWREGDVMTVMEDSIETSHRRQCPLFSYDKERMDEASKKGPGLKDIRAAGFEPVTSVRTFYGDGCYDDDDLKNIIAACPELDDLDKIRDVVIIDLRDDAFPGRMSIADLDFDAESARSRIVEQKIRGLNARDKKKSLNVFRERECSRCVYECERPPWQHDEMDTCHLTEERALESSGYVGSDSQRRWMALHILSGNKVNSRSGAATITHSPDDLGQRIRTVRRGPPFGWSSSDMSPEDVVDGLGRHPVWPWGNEERDSSIKAIVEGAFEDKTNEQMSLCYWALHRMHVICDFNEVQFRHEGKPKRNDVLYIKLGLDLGIEVGSDTRASNYGGFGGGGKGIKIGDRPRYATHYEPPYFDSFFSWFKLTPGARRR